MVNKDFHI